MHAINVNNVLGDALAGCTEVLKDRGNAQTFLRAALLRMRLFYSEDVCASLSNCIIAESKNVIVDQIEYVINETLYEFRRAGPKYNDMFEKLVIDEWIKITIQKKGQDAALDFSLMLKSNRQKRFKLTA